MKKLVTEPWQVRKVIAEAKTAEDDEDSFNSWPARVIDKNTIGS